MPAAAPRDAVSGASGSCFAAVDILIATLRLRRRAAPLGYDENAHHADARTLGKRQNVPRFQGVMRLSNAPAVDSNLARGAHALGETPGFVKPCLPQPFVEPLGFAHTPLLSARFLSAPCGAPANSACLPSSANGELGSVGRRRCFFPDLPLAGREARR